MEEILKKAFELLSMIPLKSSLYNVANALYGVVQSRSILLCAYRYPDGEQCTLTAQRSYCFKSHSHSLNLTIRAPLCPMHNQIDLLNQSKITFESVRYTIGDTPCGVNHYLEDLVGNNQKENG